MTSRKTKRIFDDQSFVKSPFIIQCRHSVLLLLLKHQNRTESMIVRRFASRDNEVIEKTILQKVKRNDYFNFQDNRHDNHDV